MKKITRADWVMAAIGLLTIVKFLGTAAIAGLLGLMLWRHHALLSLFLCLSIWPWEWLITFCMRRVARLHPLYFLILIERMAKDARSRTPNSNFYRPTQPRDWTLTDADKAFFEQQRRDRLMGKKVN